MSRGKYSVRAYKDWGDDYEFKYNAYGQESAPWNDEVQAAGVVYDAATMLPNYDEDGYDSYGYSAFDLDGNYLGIGAGVDRAGWTEMDYLTLADLDEYEREHYYD